MDTTTINIPFLKAIDACAEAIDFVKRNKLEGFPLNRLNEVQGDYYGYIAWLTGKQWEFDNRGNMIRETDTDGLKYRYEYDDYGNRIGETYPDGLEFKWEFDNRGNMIRETYPDGREFQYEYDDHGNMVRQTNSDGREYRWEYDDYGNMIRQTNPDGREYRWVTKFYTDGQLKQIGDLMIPWFVK